MVVVPHFLLLQERQVGVKLRNLLLEEGGAVTLSRFSCLAQENQLAVGILSEFVDHHQDYLHIDNGDYITCIILAVFKDHSASLLIEQTLTDIRLYTEGLKLIVETLVYP